MASKTSRRPAKSRSAKRPTKSAAKGSAKKSAKTSAKAAPKSAASVASPAQAPANASGWSNPCLPQPITKGKAAVRVWHVAAPTCFWSWGFEGTLHRIRLRYGNQVDIRFIPAVVHTNLEEWMAHNEITRKSWDSWAEKAGKKMGIPIWTTYSSTKVPNDQTAATDAVVAAFRQGHPQGERFLRELLRRNVVEGKDVTRSATLASSAKACGLDVKRFEKDLKDKVGLQHDSDHMEEGAPHVPLGFYNLIVEDGSGRTVLMDFAFDPKPVEDVIEFLTGRSLKKNKPTDPAAFLAAAGATHAIELARAFGQALPAMQKQLTRLEEKGLVKQVELAGHPYWVAGKPR